MLNQNSLMQPPESLQAEQGVIGGLLLDSSRLVDVDAIIDVNDMFYTNHKSLFAAQRKIIQRDGSVDILTLFDYIKQNNIQEDVGGLEYVAKFATNTASASNIEAYAQIIQKQSQYRKLILISQEIIENVYSQSMEPSEIIQKSALQFDAALDCQLVDGVDMKYMIELTEAMLADNIAAVKSGGMTGIPSGLPGIDDRLGGFQRKRVYVLAARPSTGKTACSNQWALHASMNGYKVGIISLEMGIEDLGFRMLSKYYEVNGTALVFGNETEAKKLQSAKQSFRLSGKQEIQDADIVLDTDTYSLSGICARLTQWKRKQGLDLVVVDHIGLVEHKSNSKYESVGEISRTLKKLSKQLDVAMLVLVQLNREGEKNKRKPQDSDLRDSGNIEQDADVIIFLHAEAETKGQNIRPIYVGLSKVRYGIPGWIEQQGGTTPFRFHGQTQTFSEVGRYENY